MRSQRWTALILLVPLGFLLWGFVQMYHRNSAYGTLADQLPAERIAAKQSGMPLTPDDLIRTPPVLPSQNAAPIYQEITRTLDQIQPASWDGVRPVILNQATEADRKMTRILLTQYSGVMERAEQASLLPECDFQRDWKQGVLLSLPEYSAIRQIIRLYAAQASLLCDANQPLEAFRSLLIAARITRHIGQDPCILALSSRMVFEMTIERPLIRVVQTFGNRPEILQLAARIEAILDEPLDFVRALQGERLLRLQTLALLRANPHALATGYPAPFPPRAAQEVVLDAWEVRCLSYGRLILSSIKSVEGDPIEIYRAVKEVADTQKSDAIGPRRRYKPTYEMSAILESDYTDVAQRLVVIEARHRLRRTQLALLNARLRVGHFPESLEALTSAPTEDPFAHQPLHYQKTNSGFLLYSVGINLVDDNGDGIPRGRNSDPPDIVIAYPPPNPGKKP